MDRKEEIIKKITTDAIAFFLNTFLGYPTPLVIGIPVSIIYNFVKNKKCEKILIEYSDEFRNKYNLGKEFEEELKDILKSLNNPSNFIKSLDDLLKKHGVNNVSAVDFLKDFWLGSCNKLSTKYKDIINVMLQFMSLDELKEICKGYKEYKELMVLINEHEARKLGFYIGTLDKIAEKIKVRAEFPYIERDEDTELLKSIIEEDHNNYIIIKGLPGSGKSTMLKNALLSYLSNKGFTHGVWLEPSYDSTQRATLITDLQKQNIDNFVIVCDDMHNINEDRLDNIRSTLLEIQKYASKKNKRFKFIGCSRSDIHLVGINLKVIELKRFTNIELVNECITYYNVRLDGINANDILNESDGTPLYIISIFIRFKSKGVISRSDLGQLPNNVIEIWKGYIKDLESNKKINDNHKAALSSIALLTHTSSLFTIDEIENVYTKVFNSSGYINSVINDLCELNLVTRVSKDNEDYYFMHDAHAEAVEKICGFYSKNQIARFINVLAGDVIKLFNLSIWLYDKQRYDKAIQCYDKVLEINPRYAEAWYNKGNAYFDMNKYDEAIKYIIKSISLFILQNKDIDLIESLTHSIIEIITQRSINEEIRKDTEVISYVSLYLIGSFTREECINKIKDLKGSARREALIHAVINNEDRHVAINDIVDEAFNDLKRCVLEMQNK